VKAQGDAEPGTKLSHSRGAWIAFVFVTAIYAVAILLLPDPDIPLNDDWMYARTVRVGLETGRMTSTGYQSPWGIPHFVLGTALSFVAGFSHAHLRWLSVASVPVILLFLTLALDRTGATFRGSLLLLSSVAFFAPFFLLSFSFMTDIVFLMFWTGTLYFWEKGHAEAGKSPVYLGSVCCALAILQRQTGVALVLANLAVLCCLPAWRRPERRSLRRHFAVVSVALLALAAATTVWWNQIPIQEGSEKPRVLVHFSAAPGSILTHLFLTLPYVGWFFLPVLAARVSVERIRRIAAHVRKRSPLWKAGAALWIGLPLSIAYVLGRDGLFMPYLGNVISQWGTFRPNQISIGERPLLFDGWLTGWTWTLVLLAAGIAGVTALTRLALSGVRTVLQSPERSGHVPGLLSATAGLGYYSALLPLVPFFDRYLLPLLLSLAMVYAFHESAVPAKRVLLPLACVICLAAMAWTLTRDNLAWSEARWRAAEWALGTGTPAAKIDGGYEWLGWRTFLLRSLNTPRSFRLSVSTSPLPGYTLLRTESYYSFWPPHERAVYVLEKR